MSYITYIPSEVKIQGGESNSGIGGSVDISGGESKTGISGELDLGTPDVKNELSSGSIGIKTGKFE